MKVRALFFLSLTQFVLNPPSFPPLPTFHDQRGTPHGRQDPHDPHPFASTHCRGKR